jgi:hypothetical protein
VLLLLGFIESLPLSPEPNWPDAPSHYADRSLTVSEQTEHPLSRDLQITPSCF